MKLHSQEDREELQDDGYCAECGGEGQKMICIDDLCHGQGFCIHGDGYIVCPSCKGESP